MESDTELLMKDAAFYAAKAMYKYNELITQFTENQYKMKKQEYEDNFEFIENEVKTYGIAIRQLEIEDISTNTVKTLMNAIEKSMDKNNSDEVFLDDFNSIVDIRNKFYQQATKAYDASNGFTLDTLISGIKTDEMFLDNLCILRMREILEITEPNISDTHDLGAA